MPAVDAICWPMPLTVVCSCCTPLAVENSASSAAYWSLFIGLSGSCDSSCVVISRKKSFWVSVVLLPLPLALFDADGNWVPEGRLVMFTGMALPIMSMSSCAERSDRQGFEGKGLGDVECVEIGLVVPRRRNHVHHFVDRIDVRHLDVAIAVGIWAARVVNLFQRLLAFDDAGDVHAGHASVGCGVVAAGTDFDAIVAIAAIGDRRRGEDDFARAIRLTRGIGDAVGIGDVTGDRR